MERPVRATTALARKRKKSAIVLDAAPTTVATHTQASAKVVRARKRKKIAISRVCAANDMNVARATHVNQVRVHRSHFQTARRAVHHLQRLLQRRRRHMGVTRIGLET